MVGKQAAMSGVLTPSQFARPENIQMRQHAAINDRRAVKMRGGNVMRLQILRGMSFVAVVVLLGGCLVQAQSQAGVQTQFTRLNGDQKLSARSIPAKVAGDDGIALASKGYVGIGLVFASEPGKKADAEIIKQLESAILQKAAEAGGDVVIFLKQGSFETTNVPTGKTKIKRDCLDSRTVNVSGAPQCTHSCYTDIHGFQHCNDVGCSPTWKEVTQCLKWGEPHVVPVTRREKGLVSAGMVWRYQPELSADTAKPLVWGGDLSNVQSLLKAHPELISSKDSKGQSPLHNAVGGKDKAVVEFLLANNADVNARDGNGATPLQIAGYSGDESMVQLLLDHKADINARNNAGETTLHQTACQGTAKMAEFLLANKADVNIRDKAGLTPLHCAAIAGRSEMVKLLLAHKADVNAGSLRGLTPLAFLKLVTKFRTKQFKEIAEILRQAGGGMVPDTTPSEIAAASAMPSQSGVGQVQSSGQTAAAANDAVSVRLKCITLADPDLDPNLADKDSGLTPLHEVAALGCKPEMKLLLAEGADINVKDHDGFTPLHWAASEGHADVAELLLAEGAGVNAKTDHGVTPLGLVAKEGHKDLAELLLANKADVNAKDDHIGFTPLHWAASEGHADVVELLLANNAEVNAKDNRGFTPLTYVGSHTDVAELLLAKGADVNAKSINGRTALHSAAEDGHKQVAELLLAKGAEVNAMNQDGYTPLFMAVVGGHADVAELLLAKGATVNAKDHDGFAPLHWAASEGHADVAELLLAKGADVDAKDKHGHAPLFWADQKGHTDVAQLLRQNGGHK